MKKKLRQQTGSALLILAGIIMALVVAAGGVFYVRSVDESLWQSSLKTVVANTDQAADIIAGKIESQWYSTELQCRTFKSVDSTDTATIQYLLAEFQTADYPVALIVGDAVYPNPDSCNLESYTYHSEQTIAAPYISGINGKRVIALENPVIFQDGTKGTLVKEVSVNDLNRAFSVSIFQDHGHSYLINPEGDILFRSTNAKGNKTSSNLYTVLESESANDKSVITEAANSIANGYSGWFTAQYDGEKNLYYYTPISQTEWYLVSVIAESNIRQQTQSILYQTFTLVGVILVCFALMIALVIHRERQNLKMIERENIVEKQLIIASNSEVNTVVLAIDPQQDSYKVISKDENGFFTMPDCKTYSELLAVFAHYIDGEYQEEYKKCFNVAHLKQLLNTEHGSEYREVVTCANGKKHWMGIEVNAVHLDGHAGMIVFSARLIDAAKADEEMRREILREARTAAEDANKAKSEFLANMSHDIRTPMNAIVGITSLMQHEQNDPEKMALYIQKLQSSSQHLLGLINDVLDMSKIESSETALTVESINLAEQVGQVDSIIRPQMTDHGHEFTITIHDIVHENLIGDSLRLRQVFINLLSNAVKYTPYGGKVQFDIAEMPSSDPERAKFHIFVQDNGYGMSQEFVKHIFDPFVRAENSTTNKIQGTGLGMAITKNIVDLMGGTITVQSELNKGSRFDVEISFPIDKNAAVSVNAKNVLLVSGDAVLAHNAQEALRSAAVKFTAVQTIEDAVAHLQTQGADVILLSGHLTDTNLADTVQRLRDADREAVLIFCCDYAQEDQIEDVLRGGGVDGFVARPFFLSTFAQAIDHAQTKSEKSASESKSILKGMNFLCAEDNDLNAEILDAILDMSGATCTIYADGNEIVKAFEKVKPGDYDAILMDVQMPNMNGLDATRAIRNGSNPLGKTIPILAMTANAFSSDVQACLDAGMNAHIAKPIDIAALEHALKSVLGGVKRQAACKA